MSLINKMLRDLDARQVGNTGPLLNTAVRPMPAPGTPLRIGRTGWILLGVVVIVLVAFTGLVASKHWLHRNPRNTSAMSLPAAPAAMAASSSGVQKVTPASPPVTPASVAVDNTIVPSPTPSQGPLATNDVAVTNLKIDAGLSNAQEQKGATLPDKLKFTTVVKSPPGTIEKVHRSDGVQESGYESYRKATSAYNQGHMSQAIELLQASLHENPRQVAARQTLLGIYVEQKQWEEAELVLKDGLNLMPEQVSWAMALARIQVERGYTADAWATLQKYQAHAEENADYQGFAGILLQQLQKPHEAAAHYRTALQLRPGEGRWWYGLGITLEADNRSGEAREAFQHARNVGGITPEMRAVIDKKLN